MAKKIKDKAMKQDTIASKVGRPPKYKTPEELEAKAKEYFDWCDANPMEVWKRKGAGASQTAANGSSVKSDEGSMLVPRPYTLDGLALWCGIADWRDYRAYHANDNFSAVIRTLEMKVRDRQVSGGLVGMYNANLTARLNGLADKQENTVNGITLVLDKAGMEAAERMKGK